MAYQVTIESVQRTLDEQGSRCPVESCGSDNFQVEYQGSSTDECAKEHFTCNTCNARWSTILYPAKIDSLTLPGGRVFEDWDLNSEVELGALGQMACPKGPIADSVRELLLQMKRGSVKGKGEALAKLAFLIRMDLNPLPDIQPLELPGLPSGTE